MENWFRTGSLIPYIAVVQGLYKSWFKFTQGTGLTQKEDQVYTSLKQGQWWSQTSAKWLRACKAWW